MNLTRILTVAAASAALIAAGAPVTAAPKDKEPKEQKEKKAKKHEHKNGKALLGERIKTNGKHKLEQRGKHTAFATVQNGKIAGVNVTDDKGAAVPVKKYKTSKKMALANGLQPASLHLAQAQYMGSTWIGYAYTDEWGDEVIYWYEYDMIYDGDTGAIEYIPVY